jgi:hypothetical protein
MARSARRVVFAVAWSFLPLAALTLVTSAATPAAAAEITGANCAGATGTVNGADATALTRDNPLVVQEGSQVLVTGSVPAAFAGGNPASVTEVKVSAVDGLIDVSGGQHTSTGATYDGSVDVGSYFDVGVGLYRVEVTNTGANNAWQCQYVAYVKLAGGTLSKPAGLVSLAAFLIGAVGVFYVKGRKPREPGWIDGALGTADQITREEAWQHSAAAHPDAIHYEERAQHGFLPATALKPNERVMWQGKVRLRGGAVAGCFWGLLLGLGLGLLGWQQARWTVNLGSVVIFPLVVAAVSAAFAWFGWGYRIRDVMVLPPQAVAADGPGAQPDGQLSFDDARPDEDPLADSSNGEVTALPTEADPAPGGPPEPEGGVPEPSTPPAD